MVRTTLRYPCFRNMFDHSSHNQPTITFVILLLGRFAFGWRGTTATRWTLVGFALLAIGYFGSKLVLEIILGGG